MFWFIFILAVWFVFGTLIYCILLFPSSPPYPTHRFNWVNPVYLYKHYEFTWLGAFVLALLMSLLSPPMTVLYWLTRKRKKSRWEQK